MASALMNQDNHDENGERRRRAQRYYDLPQWKREYIEGLQPSDIEDDQAIRQLFRDSRAVKRFWKLAAILIFSAFAFATSLGEYVVKFVAMIRGKP